MTPDGPELTTTLTEIARDISTLRSPDLLLTSIARRARRLLATDIAYISLNDSDGLETYIRATDGVRTDAYAAIRMPLGTGVLGLAAGGIIAETPDYLPDEGKTHLPDIDRVVQEEGVRAILGAPLRVAGKVVGALMSANRSPGAFARTQREHLEQIAGLTAAAVDLVAAKENEETARAYAARAAEELESVASGAVHRDALEARLAQELAERRGLEDVITAAAFATQTWIGVFDAAGVELTSSPHGHPHSDLHCGPEDRAPLIGDAAPGTVVVRHLEESSTAVAVADVVARSASIALLYERTIDDIRYFHENELLSSLLAPSDSERPALSSAMLQRALGTGGPIVIAVLSPVGADDASRRRLLARVREANQAGSTIVGGYLGRVVVASKTSGAALTERLTALAEGAGFFGGIATAATLDDAPAAYAQASSIAAAMRALERPAVIAGAAEAGIAGLLLRDGDRSTAQLFVGAHLGSLADHPRGRRLAETALIYLDAHGSTNATADALGIHPNTVRQRIERIDAELTPAWRLGPRRLDMHVALRLWQLHRGS